MKQINIEDLKGPLTNDNSELALGIYKQALKDGLRHKSALNVTYRMGVLYGLTCGLCSGTDECSSRPEAIKEGSKDHE